MHAAGEADMHKGINTAEQSLTEAVEKALRWDASPGLSDSITSI
jgi:hypothetical protein